MRFYRALLHLYPSDFRREYTDELCRAFADSTRGRTGAAVVVAAVTDVVPNAVAARWAVLRHGGSGGMALPTAARDIRFTLRQIVRAPLFSGIIIAVIALGIGINTALLTALHTVVWQPAPGIEGGARLARLTPAQNGRVGNYSVSYPDILDLRERHQLFDDVAAWGWASAAADFGDGAEAVTVNYTTGNFFQTLGVRLAAGTAFADGADRSAAPIVVLGHSLAVAHFGDAANAVGKTIRLMNQPFTIVGVAPPRFVGPDVLQLGAAMVWMPLGARGLIEPARADSLMRRNAMTLKAVLRLAPGVDAGDVDRFTGPIAARIAALDPSEHAKMTFRAERLTGVRSADRGTRELVVAFLLVAALIVLITCTNVSALLLGRAVARRREVGVRLSLGATRMRLIRQMLTESLVFATAGAVLGVALYAVVMKIAYATLPETAYGLEPNVATFVYAGVFAVATTIVFGLAPALHATNADIGEVLKNGGLAIKRSRIQSTFVVVQLACSAPVLVLTSLALSDLRGRLTGAADAAPASVVTMSVDFLGPVDGRTTLEPIRRRIGEVNGVLSVALAATGEWRRPEGPASGKIIAQTFVSAGYFSALGIPMARGRAIGAEDDQPASVTAVVNEAAARLLWPGDDPVGKRLVLRASTAEGAATSLEIIGVAGKAGYVDDEEATTPRVYAALSGAASLRDLTITKLTAGNVPVDIPAVREVTIVVRAPGDARALVPSIRAAIRDIEPLAAIGNINTLAEQYASRRREAVLSNAAAFGIGAAALLLASLGLYAIIAFAVAQRTREIGIRLAVGATSGAVVRQFFRHGLKVTAIGLAIGLPVTVAGIRVVKASLFGFTIGKVVPVLVVVPVLIGIAALASWLPARRAGRVNPIIALRSE